MKRTTIFFTTILFTSLIIASCGPSTEDQAKAEEKKLEQEEAQLKASLLQAKKDSIAQVKRIKKDNITYIKGLFKKDNQASLERTTANKLDIIDISSLTNATGWIQARDGDKWISAKNKIPHPSGYTFDDYTLGHNMRNFKSYKFKKLNIKGEELILFSDFRKTGYYTYKNIREGWNNNTECYIVIFKASELEKFNNIVDEKANEVKIQALATVRGYLKTETYTLENLGQLIREDSYVDYNQEYSFKILPIKEKGKTRFLCTNISDYGGHESNIDKYYFETSYDAFSKFITFQ